MPIHTSAERRKNSDAKKQLRKSARKVASLSRKSTVKKASRIAKKN